MISEQFMAKDNEDRRVVVNFHHNGDYSGDVVINKRASATDITQVEEITIPMEVIKEFVASYVLSERTRTLEDMSTDDLLGVSK